LTSKQIESEVVMKSDSDIVSGLLRVIAQAEKQGVTRYQIAQRSGVSEGQLSRLVNRTVFPRLDTAERIAEACGYEIRFVPKKKST